MRLINLLVTLAVVGALLSLGALLSRHHMILDIGSHFRLQYIILLLPALLLAIFGKRFYSAIVLFGVLAVHGYSVGESLRAVEVQQTDRFTDLRILSANLFLDNNSYQEFKDLVSTIKPDVLALQEYTPRWHESLSRELDEFPHRISEPMRGAFGIALYSKHPIASGGLVKFGKGLSYSIDVELSVDGGSLRVINVHPPPPSHQTAYEHRNTLMADVAKAIKQHKTSIVVGDFNTTPWAGHFADMESRSGLLSARRGNGIAATWPDSFFPLLIPIDHILVSKNIAVTSLKSVPVVGSDHRAMVGGLRVFFPP